MRSDQLDSLQSAGLAFNATREKQSAQTCVLYIGSHFQLIQSLMHSSVHQSLPCQSCIKRGLANVCVYPDPDNDPSQPPQQQTPQPTNKRMYYSPTQPRSRHDRSNPTVTAGQVQVTPGQASFVPGVPPQTPQQAGPQAAQQPGPYYYDYQASNSSFRPAKRPRPLTEEETAAITKNFQRGAFYIGTSMVRGYPLLTDLNHVLTTTQPIRIDPRLPVRLTLGEGDQVHFEVSSDIA